MSFTRYFIGVFLLLATTISCSRKQHDTVKDVRFLDEMDLSVLSEGDKRQVLDSLFTDAMDEENSKSTRLYLLELADKFDVEEEEARFLQLLNRARTFSKEESDSLTLAKTFESLGGYYENKMEFDSTYFFYQQAGKWYKALSDSVKIAEMALGKASILYDFGFYTESEVETIRVLRYVKKEHKPMLVYQCYQLLGLVLCELKSFEESLNYYRLTQAELERMNADGTFERADLPLAYGALYNNIAGAYEVNGDFVQANTYYQKALDLKGIDESTPAIYSALLNNNSFVRLQINDTVGVLNDLKKAEGIRLKTGNIQEVISSKLNIGEYYFKKDKPVEGLRFVRDAYDLAVSMNSEYDQKEALIFLAEHDLVNKNRFTKEYVRIVEKIQAEERATRNKFARIVYETEDMINKNELLKERNKRIIIIATIVVGFLIFMLLVLRLSSRNKQLLFLQRQQEANQQIYRLVIEQQQKTHKAKVGERNRIAKELHDGIVNRIFTTRFNLMQLDTTDTARKQLLVQELVKAEEEVRAISHELVSHQVLEDKAFEEVVKKLIELQQNSFGTHFELSIDRAIDWEAMSSDVRMHIFRILQETLQNVNRYSKAKNCTIWILKTKDKVTLRISDDGIGFDAEKIKQGLGFRSLKERVAEINGVLTLDTAEGHGTTLEIVF